MSDHLSPPHNPATSPSGSFQTATLATPPLARTAGVDAENNKRKKLAPLGDDESSPPLQYDHRPRHRPNDHAILAESHQLGGDETAGGLVDHHHVFLPKKTKGQQESTLPPVRPQPQQQHRVSQLPQHYHHPPLPQLSDHRDRNSQQLPRAHTMNLSAGSSLPVHQYHLDQYQYPHHMSAPGRGTTTEGQLSGLNSKSNGAGIVNNSTNNNRNINNINITGYNFDPMSLLLTDTDPFGAYTGHENDLIVDLHLHHMHGYHSQHSHSQQPQYNSQHSLGLTASGQSRKAGMLQTTGSDLETDESDLEQLFNNSITAMSTQPRANAPNQRVHKGQRVAQSNLQYNDGIRYNEDGFGGALDQGEDNDQQIDLFDIEYKLCARHNIPQVVDKIVIHRRQVSNKRAPVHKEFKVTHANQDLLSISYTAMAIHRTKRCPTQEQVNAILERARDCRKLQTHCNTTALETTTGAFLMGKLSHYQLTSHNYLDGIVYSADPLPSNPALLEFSVFERDGSIYVDIPKPTALTYRPEVFHQMVMDAFDPESVYTQCLRDAPIHAIPRGRADDDDEDDPITTFHFGGKKSMKVHPHFNPPKSLDLGASVESKSHNGPSCKHFEETAKCAGYSVIPVHAKFPFSPPHDHLKLCYAAHDQQQKRHTNEIIKVVLPGDTSNGAYPEELYFNFVPLFFLKQAVQQQKNKYGQFGMPSLKVIVGGNELPPQYIYFQNIYQHIDKGSHAQATTAMEHMLQYFKDCYAQSHETTPPLIFDYQPVLTQTQQENADAKPDAAGLPELTHPPLLEVTPYGEETKLPVANIFLSTSFLTQWRFAMLMVCYTEQNTDIDDDGDDETRATTAIEPNCNFHNSTSEQVTTPSIVAVQYVEPLFITKNLLRYVKKTSTVVDAAQDAQQQGSGSDSD